MSTRAEPRPLTESERLYAQIESKELTVAQVVGIYDFTQPDVHAWLSPLVDDHAGRSSYLLRSHVESLSAPEGPVLWMADRGHVRYVTRSRRSSWLYVILVVAALVAAVVRDHVQARAHDAQVARLNAIAESNETPKGTVMPLPPEEPTAPAKIKKPKRR